MNREEIIRIAKEAGGDDWGIFKDFMPEIERFAALVAAEEREACIRDCDSVDLVGADDCIAAIRARGQQ